MRVAFVGVEFRRPPSAPPWNRRYSRQIEIRVEEALAPPKQEMEDGRNATTNAEGGFDDNGAPSLSRKIPFRPYRADKEFSYVVVRCLFLLSLNYSAWLLLNYCTEFVSTLYIPSVLRDAN